MYDSRIYSRRPRLTKLTGEFTVTAWDEEAHTEREGAPSEARR